MVFTENAKDEGERFRGDMKWNTIANAGAKKMQNFVSVVSESNFESFMQREPAKHKVLLLTDKKSTPALFKALSKKYLDKLVFGEIRASETDLIAKFGEQIVYPSLLAVTNVESLETVKFDGEMKVD